MSESVVASLRFTGIAQTAFRPAAQLFSVSHELLLGAFRISIDGQLARRPHETLVNVKSEEDDYLNYAEENILEGQTTTFSFRHELFRCMKGVNYKLQINIADFAPEGEEVMVAIDLLELDTTLARVTKDVLMKAEKDLNINAMTFGISEATFTTLMTSDFTAPEIKVGQTAGLKMILSMEWLSHPPWPYIELDVDAKVFVIHGDLLLSFEPVTRGESQDAVADARATLQLRCHPAMVTSTDDTLQLQFDSAILSNLDISIHDNAPILVEFESIQDFKDAVNAYVDQLVTRTGPLGFALPAYLQSRAIPDYWHHVMNMELAFGRFDYRNVNVHGFTIAYLFVVFSVRGLNLPIPCYCETEWAAVRESQAVSATSLEANAPAANATDAQAQAVSVEASSAQRIQNRPKANVRLVQSAPTGSARSVSELLTAPYANILVPAQLSSIGISQNTFQEIAKPIADMGLDESVSKGGTIYVSARARGRCKLESAKILSDGINAIIDVKLEGTARAAIKNECGGGDVASASAQLRIAVNDSSLQWRLRIHQETTAPYALIVDADPTVSIGKPDIKFESALDPPPPLDKVDDWIFTRLAIAIKPILEILAREKARLRLIRTEENNGDITLRFIDDTFFEGEAAVVVGQLVRNYG